MNYRKATEKDLDQVSELFNAYRVFYRKDSNLENVKIFLRERIKNNDSELFVAEEEKEVLGFVQLYPLFSSKRMNNYGY